MKEIKDGINRWRDIPCSWVGRINLLKITITTKCNLQIQCDPYQITNDIFHKTKTKNFKIHMQTQKTPHSQSSLENEEWNWRNQTSWLQIILQSYSHQDNMVLAEKQKYRPTEQDRKPRNKPLHLWISCFLTKAARIYSGAKTASSMVLGKLDSYM